MVRGSSPRPPPIINNLNFEVMTKTLGKYITEKQLDRGMRTLLGSLIHTQTRLKSVLDLAEGTMSEMDLERSDAYNALCSLDEHLESAFKELCNELGKEK